MWIVLVVSFTKHENIRRIWLLRLPKLAIGHPLCTQKEDCIGDPSSVGGNPVLGGEPVSLKSCGSEVVPKLWTGNVQRCWVLLESNQTSKLYFLKCRNPIEFIRRQHEEPGLFLYARKDITKYCFNLLDHLFFVLSTQNRLLLDSCHINLYQSV